MISNFFKERFYFITICKGSFFSIFNLVSFFALFNHIGNIGVDLSSNPTVDEGVLLSTAFSGVGNYVNGYTVGSYTNYYFTKEWFVNLQNIICNNIEHK
mgnify:CR=1 FL=1